MSEKIDSKKVAFSCSGKEKRKRQKNAGKKLKKTCKKRKMMMIVRSSCLWVVCWVNLYDDDQDDDDDERTPLSDLVNVEISISTELTGFPVHVYYMLIASFHSIIMRVDNDYYHGY